MQVGLALHFNASPTWEQKRLPWTAPRLQGAVESVAELRLLGL